MPSNSLISRTTNVFKEYLTTKKNHAKIEIEIVRTGHFPVDCMFLKQVLFVNIKTNKTPTNQATTIKR